MKIINGKKGNFISLIGGVVVIVIIVIVLFRVF